jgi:hypothetical protein
MEFPASSKRIYPTLVIPRNVNPSRFYALPVIGGLVKLLLLIPGMIMLFVISLIWQVTVIINVFVVLLTGRYWRFSFEVCDFYNKYSLKTALYFLGVTNKHPGFSSKIADNFSITIPFPTNPNRLYAFPVFGFVVRFIIMLPFMFWSGIVYYGYIFLSVISSFSVLLKGYFPESTHELIVDGLRLGFSANLFFAGISDTLPSYKISMNHKVIKIIALTIGLIYLLYSIATDPDTNRYNKYPNQSPSSEKPYSS